MPAQGIVGPKNACIRGPQHEDAILTSIARCWTAGQTVWPSGEMGWSMIGNVKGIAEGPHASVFKAGRHAEAEACFNGYSEPPGAAVPHQGR